MRRVIYCRKYFEAIKIKEQFISRKKLFNIYGENFLYKCPKCKKESKQNFKDIVLEKNYFERHFLLINLVIILLSCLIVYMFYGFTVSIFKIYIYLITIIGSFGIAFNYFIMYLKFNDSRNVSEILDNNEDTKK
ncbi:hypothetical protein [Flammeovirga aprica]|uniref:Uncharacterized protein n=1 Tax=Flammeovirga aprica JL-4 TaxID=694437 RepID=A0A7X9S207_9BACT|nr:hypothetical protein [Flammeovirga aprica]NME72930.1 hypothetical protein [Flammeovirga aprica JL-4]